MEQVIWHVIYTKPRSEKKVADRLGKAGFETYCPLQTTIRQWSDRKKKVTIPVIPSYVFVKVKETERTKVLDDPGVVNFVFWLGKPAIVRNEELIHLKLFLEKYTDIYVQQLNIKEGDKVSIDQGILKGQDAEITKVGKNTATIALYGTGIVLTARIRLKVVSKAGVNE